VLSLKCRTADTHLLNDCPSVQSATYSAQCTWSMYSSHVISYAVALFTSHYTEIESILMNFCRSFLSFCLS
jgi:hypothetical protein